MSKENGKKILITGGCGFIGSNMAVHYLAKGWEVVTYDNYSRPGAKKNATWLEKSAISFQQVNGMGHLRQVRGDVCDLHLLFGPCLPSLLPIDSGVNSFSFPSFAHAYQNRNHQDHRYQSNDGLRDHDHRSVQIAASAGRAGTVVVQYEIPTTTDRVDIHM